MSDAELDQFLESSWPGFRGAARKYKEEQAEFLFRDLQKNPDSIYPSFIVDLYLASKVSDSPDFPTYTSDQVDHLTVSQLEELGLALGLPLDQINNQRVIRILQWSHLLVNPDLDPKQLFLPSNPANPILCRNLDLQSALNLRQVLGISEWECPFNVKDRDKLISWLSPINSETLKLGRTIQQFGSKRLYLPYSDFDTFLYFYEHSSLSDETIPREKLAYNPVVLAASLGNLEVVGFLLDHGFSAQIRTDGYYPLQKAIEKRDVEMAELLVRKGARITPVIYDKTLFEMAVALGDLNLIRLMLELQGSNLPVYERVSALEEAMSRNRLDMVQVIITEPPSLDINYRDLEGETFLFKAAENGWTQAVKYLLEKGADPNLPNNKGKTPLVKALEYGQNQAVKYLLEKGADPNLRDHRRKTALDRAIEHSNQDIIALLLEAGAIRGN